MSREQHTAGAVLHGDARALERLASRLIKVERDNLVERPWGGDWIKSFKRVASHSDSGLLPWGEAFELAAFDEDAESARYPSTVSFGDGSTLALPALLKSQGERLLGASFVKRYGACYPLLPKTLDVKELLSVQGHPPGNTEVYIVIDAEPGATLRLGFSRDVDRASFGRDLKRGLAQQAELLTWLMDGHEPIAMQTEVAPWFANREQSVAGISGWIAGAFGQRAADAGRLLEDLKSLYWQVLDSMNAVEARSGQVIYNATPKRLLDASGSLASAEVHALGNPEGKEILALEIRRPGPTFRAWDNVRFPPREVDVDAALDALNLRATAPDEFACDLAPIDGRAGAFVSVDCEYFRVEHLVPASGESVDVPLSGPHSLHCLAGAVDVLDGESDLIGHLESGESALAPIGVGGYRIVAESDANVVRVTLPGA